MRGRGFIANRFVPQQPQRETRVESGMTCEQQFNSIAENVMLNLSHRQKIIKGCEMHPQISAKCRKCQQITTVKEKQLLNREQRIELSSTFPQIIRYNSLNPKLIFGDKLLINIESSTNYRITYKPCNSVKELLSKMTSEQISMDAFQQGTTDSPTDFIAMLYRLTELHPTREQLVIMLRSNNVNIRCLGLLYLRLFGSFQDVYACLAGSFEETKLVSAAMTVGEYAMRLLDENQLNHGGLRLPRIPIKIQQQITHQIEQRKSRVRERQEEIQMSQQRSRSRQKHVESYKNMRYDRPSSDKLQSVSALVQQPSSVLSFKERIGLLQKKQKDNLKRKQLLQQYQTYDNNLADEPQEKQQSDDCERYQLG